MISKLVKKKEKAFSLGVEYFNLFKAEFNEYSMQSVSKELVNRFIGLNVFDVTKYMYNNNNFYEYLKYTFLGKYYGKKIALIEWLIIILFVLIGVVLYFIFGLGVVFAISVIVLFIGLFIIFKFFIKTGETYSSYYNRTMMQFLYGVYGNLSFGLSSTAYVSDDELKVIIDNTYDKKSSKNNLSFNGNVCNGNISDLELIRVIETKNKDGGTTKRDDKIFDGFYLKITTSNNFNMLKGNTIKIRSDENILSSLAEDTVKGIYESDKEISFNSEEMNKSFDGRISGYNGFATVDDMMIQVQKILTPSFEQHLLYLRERYNSFNMNITDSGLVMTVNMERSLFQKAKHNELLDFTTTYREANEKFRMLKSDISGIEDFAYYNVFPFLERLYLINYLTYLYLSYMDFDNYYSINSGNITSFEESMKTIYSMDNNEFKKLYTDKIKEIKNNTKNFANEFKG